MKKIISLILAVLMMTGTCAAVSATAYAESASYKIIRVTPSKNNAAADIQKALDKAKKNATAKKKYKIIIKKGTYKINKQLIVYSNTYLVCTNVTLKKGFPNNTLFSVGKFKTVAKGYKAYKNITFDGGTFDCNGSNGKIQKGALTLFHATNVTIKNVTMTNVKNGHHLAIAGCNKVTITNCTFSKHYKSSSNTDSLEAVHLDILQKERFPGLASKSYDGTMNKNITVENCKFKNVDRGAGTHSIFTGKYMSNIVIKNNKFTNVKGYAIQGSGYISSTITGNKIKNCGAGIYFRSVIAGTDTTYKYGNKITHDTGTVIANNTISVRDNNSNDYEQTPYGIRIYGYETTSATKISGGKLAAGDYRQYNVTVKNNKITMKRDGYALWVDGGVNCSFISNTATYETNCTGSTTSYPLRIANSENITATDNTITCNSVSIINSGAFIDSSEGVSLSQNVITGANGDGILLKNCTITLTSNTVSDNAESGVNCLDGTVLTSNSNTYKSNKSHGLKANSSTATVSMTNDTLSSNKENGVNANASSVTMSECTVKSNNKSNSNGIQAGIYITQGAKVSLNNCSVKSNKGYGIYITQSSSSAVSGCTVNSNSNIGIYVTQSSSADISGCTVNSNSNDGIYVTQSSNAAISGCSISGNDNGIYLTSNATGSVKSCNIYNNLSYGIYKANAAGTFTFSNNTTSNPQGDRI